MSKRINELINIIVGISIGVFIGYGLYSFWDFKSHPELYAMQSAPWYTRLILWGAVTIGIVAIAAIIKLIIRKRKLTVDWSRYAKSRRFFLCALKDFSTA